MKGKIIKLIINLLKEIGEEIENKQIINAKFNTHLYGSQGNLDSITLVRLIIDIEEKVSEEFSNEIVIADERAMSQNRSPFRTVESLADYITMLLEENNNE